MMLSFFIIFNCFLLLLLSTVYAFIDRKIQARAQHRVGIKHAGIYGYQHVLAWGLKSLSKNAILDWKKAKWPQKIILLLIIISPFLFYTLLMMDAAYLRIEGAALWLCLTLLLFLLAENFFLFFDATNYSRLKIRQNQLTSLLGFSIFFLCMLVPITKLGSVELEIFNQRQSHFPFLIALSSPAAFLSSIISFISLFFIFGLPPIGQLHEKHVGVNSIYLLLCAKRLWIVATTSFVVFLYFGGDMWHFGGALFYFLRLFLFLFLLILIGVVLPSLRSSSSLEILVKFLLPAVVCCLVFEIFWMGLLR